MNLNAVYIRMPVRLFARVCTTVADHHISPWHFPDPCPAKRCPRLPVEYSWSPPGVPFAGKHLLGERAPCPRLDSCGARLATQQAEGIHTYLLLYYECVWGSRQFGPFVGDEMGVFTRT